MAINRYKNAAVIDDGSGISVSPGIEKIREAVASGALQCSEVVLKGREHLDVLAGVLYDNSKYWWVLAATSDIGWGMQAPPGTVIKVPDIADVAKLLR